ncbi:hypothetical protein [Paenibacillus chitinolyticus]
MAAPAANRGTYEKKLARNISEVLKLKVTAIVSDLADVHDTEDNYEDANVRYVYFKRRNGNELRKTLNMASVCVVDIIRDIKGYMWHNVKQAERIFNEYGELLNKGGIIVFEAYPQKGVTSNIFIYRIFDKIIGYTENSTYTNIKSIYKNNNKIQRLFEEILIKDPDNSVYDLVVYKKNKMFSPKRTDYQKCKWNRCKSFTNEGRQNFRDSDPFVPGKKHFSKCFFLI